MNKDNLLGRTVFNKMNDLGTVASCDDKHIVISFSNKEATFKCPQAFLKGFLRAEDADIQEKLVAEAKELEAKKNEEREKQLSLLIENKRNEALQRGVRGSHRATVTKGEIFRTHAEALNECFGYSYKHYQIAFKQIDDNYGAWFPSIAKRVMGKYVVADTSCGWLNILCENDTVILEKNIENTSKNVSRDKAGFRFVFAKYDGQNEYTFVGLFSSNPVPTKEGFRYKRVGTKIDLNNMTILDN